MDNTYPRSNQPYLIVNEIKIKYEKLKLKKKRLNENQ